MTKIYPNSIAEPPSPASSSGRGGGEEVVLTVWRKSLLFNSNGFTVFNSKGDLAFRVDNYMSRRRGDILLMDAVGKPLLTIRRKRLSLGDHWLIFEGEEESNPKFSIKKQTHPLLGSKSKILAHAKLCTATNNAREWAYEIEGSYAHRCCSISSTGDRRRVAEIKRKEGLGGVGFGDDVFRLFVQPGLEPEVAMAFVILLEHMFGAKGR